MKHTKISKTTKIAPYIIYSFIPIALLSLVFFSTSAHADNPQNLNFSVNIEPIMNLTLSDTSVNLSLNPNHQSFDSQTLNTTVATNSGNGYMLFVSSNGTSLINQTYADKVIETLPASESGYTEETFPANYWGYKLNSSNYLPYTSGLLVSSSDAPTSSNSSTLTFGAKADYNTKAGDYKLVLNFQAVPKVSTQYIQNLDSELCTSEPLVVTDTRDGQSYTVQRLADGNCWMLDNLRLGGKYQIALTPTDTNIEKNWTLPASTNEPFYYVDIAMINADYKEDKAPVWYGLGSGKIGTYYNYCAASAGTYCYSDTAGEGNASHDICPAGWHLPTGGQNGEYDNLFLAYHSDYSEFFNGFSATISGAWYREQDNRLNGHGYFWTSTIRSSASRMYYLNITTSSADSKYDNHRMFGYSVRCLLQEP